MAYLGTMSCYDQIIASELRSFQPLQPPEPQVDLVEHVEVELRRLCRYITRPALGHKRLRRTPAGEVVLQLKTPYRDGTTHLVMSPLEFLQRLAALVQRPRLHLIRFGWGPGLVGGQVLLSHIKPASRPPLASPLD